MKISDMKNQVLTLLMLVSFFYLKAGNVKNSLSSFQDDPKKTTIEEKLKKYEGTFQIQVKDMRYKPSIPFNIDELIEKNRKPNEVTYVPLGSAVRLKVLPLSEIKNASGKKMEMISTYND